MREAEHAGAKPPASALALGLAGVLPFAWGALTDAVPALFEAGQSAFGPRFVGQYVLIFYGTIILSFMSGVLWGFSTRAGGGTAALGYALSTVPALWAFFLVGGGEQKATWALLLGFAGLLVLDFGFWRLGLAPVWWMRLRGLLTALVAVCLLIGLAA